MGDDPIVISSGLVITPESVMSRSFNSAFRGFHPAEVRQFLKRVSDEMAASAGREVELRRALQDALTRAAHPEMDEATVTRVLGEHAARLISAARDTATSITTEAQKQAEALMSDTEARAARIREEAEGLLSRRAAEADAATAGLRQSTEAEARAARDKARAEAGAIVEAARTQGREMIAEARALRERMLGDLARRRRAAQVQIEQLHAARDRLLAAYDVVRRTLDQATTELTASGPEARMAAEAVGRRAEESDIPARPMRRDDPPPAPAPPSAPASPSVPLALAEEPAPPAQADEERAVAAGGGGLGPSPGPLRQVEERPPAPAPDRPPLRPQTVADVAPARPPAPAAPVEAAPPVSPVADAAPVTKVAVIEPPAPSEPSEPPEAPSKVEELFSRLRAERQQQAAAPAETPAPEAAPPEAAPEVDAVVTETALEGRDDLLDNVEAGLTRALKRVLQNEQNEVLDAMRRLGAPSDAALPEAPAQVAAYRDAALPWLQQAARAGVGYASDPSPGSEEETAHPPVEPQAEALALELVDPLRERLVRALAEAEGGEDPSVAAEAIRAVYRQWKTQHVEDCARHHSVAAFSMAAFAATPGDAVLRWLVDDDGHCPDCDDNALAGPTPKGQAFPTGQAHPPAHRGCRCLLVPVAG